MSPKTALLRVAIAFTTLVVCVPIAGVLTLLTLPLWSWVEGRFGIESIGHSGPAEWCYLIAYAFVLCVAIGLWRFTLHHRRSPRPPAANH